MSDKDVKIVVKNVYAPSETQQFVVVDSLAVRTLKEMLQAALPGNPQPKHQKLIFGGKICDDSHTLAKVLAGQNQSSSPKHGDNTDEDPAPFVFHLMVSGPTTPVARPPTPPTPSATATPTPAPVSVAAVPAAPLPAPATVGATPGPQPHVAPMFPSMGFFGAAPATAGTPAVPTSGLPHPHPQHQHQHLYTQAFLVQQQAMILSQIQYLQMQLQHHNTQPTTDQPAHAPHHAPFPHYGHFGHHNPYMYGMPHAAAYGHAAGAHVPGFPAPQAAGVAPADAAAAAAAAPAAIDPRDRNPIIRVLRELAPLFDIRLAMKMTFMLFIIGQDTPTDRLVVLALMSFGAYLHITGILAKIFEMIKRVGGAQANADANVGANANNADGNAAPPAPGRLGAITRHLRIASDRGFVQDVRYFFVGLLLSLVPAWHPQPLAVDGAAPARPEPVVADAGAEIPLQGI